MWIKRQRFHLTLQPKIYNGLSNILFHESTCAHYFINIMIINSHLEVIQVDFYMHMKSFCAQISVESRQCSDLILI